MLFNAVNKNWRLYCFIGALFLYGLWGSPTPNNPNWVEFTIALLLILAVGGRDLYAAFKISWKDKVENWRLTAQIFLIFGLSVPVMIAVLNGAPIDIIFRDIVGFVFLCLPLFIVPFLKRQEGHSCLFINLCMMIGLMFAARVLIPHFLLFRNTTELLYLANSPLVLMSALYLAAMAFYFLYQRVSLRTVIQALIYMSLASIAIMAMFVDLQRASFLALALSAFSLIIIGLMKAPMRMVAPIFVIVLSASFVAPYILDVMQNVGLKTSQVGLNMRTQELLAVWDNLSASGWSILFGQGWGSSFASPAVGMLNVTYTHSLLSYIFFKMGLVGLFLCLVYLFFIFEKLVRVYCTDPVKGTALIWPFIIPIFLYASHKSFDFGLLLSLILLSAALLHKEAKT